MISTVLIGGICVAALLIGALLVVALLVLVGGRDSVSAAREDWIERRSDHVRREW
jgi:hypothetical protein